MPSNSTNGTTQLKRRAQSSWLILAGGLVPLLWLTGCSKDSGEKAPIVTVQTSVAQKKQIQRVISAEAILFPLHQAALTPKVSAPVRKFLVNRGSPVKEGQLLAILENTDLAASEMENKGSYEQAQADYAKTTSAALPEELQKAETDVRVARQALDAEQKVFDSRDKLYQEGALPRKDFDQAKVGLVQARTQYELAQKHWDALQATGKQQALRAAAGQLTAAKGKYMGAAAQLQYSEIRSPINGVVTDRPLYPGEMAPAGTPLLTVMDLSQVIAKAHIPQEEAALLKEGDSATIEVSSGGAAVPARVTLVSPAVDTNSTTIEVWVQAANPGRALKPGTTVRVSMVAAQVADTIVVPATAVLTGADGTTTVMVVGTDQHAHQQSVKVGIHNGEEVQIVTGLKAGDQVITAGAYGLPDNTQVRAQEAANRNHSEEGGKSDSEGR